MPFYFEKINKKNICLGGCRMKKYEKLSKDIVEAVGGKENVISLHHCVTRLRFKLKNNDKADMERLKKMDGVATALISGE